MNKIIHYVMSDKGRIPIDQAYPIYYNLLTSDLNGIEQQFKSISQNRKRKSSTNGYHIIMSWDVKDSTSGVLSREVVDDMANKFIELRGADAVCLAVQHRNNENIHVHFLFSSHDISSTKSLRINNEQFRSIRAEMEQYQLENYPTLRSDVYEHYRDSSQNRIYEKSGLRVSDAEYYAEKKTNGELKKNTVRHMLRTLLKKNPTEKQWFKAIQSEKGFKLNFYRGKVNGVLFEGKKYRFSRLGVEHPESIKLKELNQLTKSESKNRQR
ncbi:MAG: relaxase/mobilization nuclease domain-containing protein [Bacteroidota bacterium]